MFTKVFSLASNFERVKSVFRFCVNYHIFPKYLDRQVWAASIDPDQIWQDAICSISTGSKIYFFYTFLDKYGKR